MSEDQNPAPDREPGWYWIKPVDDPDDEWIAVVLKEGNLLSTDEWLIGPRIHPPSDPSADFVAAWDAAIEELRVAAAKSQRVDERGRYDALWCADYLSARRRAVLARAKAAGALD